MIKIFNRVSGKSIFIDETLPGVSFEPNDWHETPNLMIKLEGINFLSHAETCEDCRAFEESFGTETYDWYVEYLNKIKRLDLSSLGEEYKKNHLSWEVSSWFSGSILKLNLDTDTIDYLEEQLVLRENIEDYEGCTKILNKIRSIK